MNKILKHLIRPFYNIYRNRKNGQRAFHHAKALLNRGVYYSPSGTGEIKKVDGKILHLNNLLQFSIYINKRDGVGLDSIHGYYCKPVDRINYGLGQGKCVLLTEDKAYGFYESSRLYTMAKEHYLYNYEDFNYPHVDVYGFDDSRKVVAMSKVGGVFYSDIGHDRKIVKELLRLACFATTKLASDNEIVYLQHGDAKRENILWQDDKYCFIDLDNIQYLPPLFDVFHYLNGYKMREIIAFIYDNDLLFKQVCLKALIDYNSNPLDVMFYRYVRKYKEWGVSFHDFSFLSAVHQDQFPMTFYLLNKA